MPRHCLDGTNIAGRGPTSGARSARYEATAPDGALVVKRTYKVAAPKAFMGLYKGLDGAWRSTGIALEAATVQAYSDIVVAAERRS